MRKPIAGLIVAAGLVMALCGCSAEQEVAEKPRALVIRNLGDYVVVLNEIKLDGIDVLTGDYPLMLSVAWPQPGKEYRFDFASRFHVDVEFTYTVIFSDFFQPREVHKHQFFEDYESGSIYLIEIGNGGADYRAVPYTAP